MGPEHMPLSLKTGFTLSISPTPRCGVSGVSDDQYHYHYRSTCDIFSQRPTLFELFRQTKTALRMVLMVKVWAGCSLSLGREIQSRVCAALRAQVEYTQDLGYASPFASEQYTLLTFFGGNNGPSLIARGSQQRHT
jgi:hypothetical protein